jgi:serine/threonine protein kinase
MLDACKANASSNLILCIAMELCHGNLRTHLDAVNNEFFAKPIAASPANAIRDGRGFTDGDRKDQLDCAKQICDGLRFLHSIKLVHRSLTPTNILYVNEADGRKTFKITDFGLAKLFDASFPNTKCGVMFYSAPEQLISQYYGMNVDIYSFGVILFEILYPVKGYNELQDIFKKMKRYREIPADFKQVHPRMSTLIMSMIDIVYQNRPSLDQIMTEIDQEMERS